MGAKQSTAQDIEDGEKTTPWDLADAENHTVGTPQPRKCKDLVWAVLFVWHLIAMGAATYVYVPMAALEAYENYHLNEYVGNNGTFAYGNGNGRALRELGYYNGEEEEEEEANVYYADDNGEEAEEQEDAYYAVEEEEEEEEKVYYAEEEEEADDGEEEEQEDEDNEAEGYYANNNGKNNAKNWEEYYPADAEDSNEDGDDAEADQFSYMEYYQANSKQLLQLVAIVGAISLVVSAVNLQVLVCCAKPLIKLALVFNIFLSSVFAAIAFLTGNMIGGGIASFFAVVALWFACRVWKRVPFAAANMATATSAIKANIGVTTYAYLSIVVSFLWNIWWFVTVSSYAAVMYSQMEEKAQNAGEGENVDIDPVSGFVMFLFFVSYYWVYQVIKNHLHVTVAGVVGTWWFNPIEASSCCSWAVSSSWCRAGTMSFGSICFGSLLVAIIQGIRDMLQTIKDTDNTGIIVCIIDCFLGCIESLAEYFNQWAYVYVGVYGYGFIDAAKNVFTLFKERGWTSIIADYLVDRVLLMLSILMGLFIGLVSVGVAVGLDINMEPEVGGPIAPFMLGFVLGLGLNAILMQVIGSAVNTVIVCYAEAPADFNQNHPELASKMRYAYGQAYPDKFTQTDSPDYTMA